MSARMLDLASTQEGFIAVESAREEIGITVSYWKDLDSIRRWKANAEHLVAQDKAKKIWYQSYFTRICKVERHYGVKL